MAAGTHEGSPVRVADAIYDSFRSHRNDRCAVFMQDDEIERFLEDSGLDAERLDPGENFHWQGMQTSLKRKWKRIIIGDYVDWFSWCMQWQRFNAFHTVVLFRPLSRTGDDEGRGYTDGFLTRLLNKPSLYRIIVIEETGLLPVAEQWMGNDPSISHPELAKLFGTDKVREAILATLFGTRLSHTDLTRAVGRTLSAKLNPDWPSILQRTESSPIIRRRNNFRVLTDEAMESVQSLSRVSTKTAEHELGREGLFRLSRKREHLRADDRWVE